MSKTEYNKLIANLGRDLSIVTNKGTDAQLKLPQIQKRLDLLADIYQDDETIGKDRYKLYDLQAYIHYFNHKDKLAADFIANAVEMKGEDYPNAKWLRSALRVKNDKDIAVGSISQQPEQISKFARIIGIAIVLIIGLIISVAINTGTDADADKKNQQVLDICTQDPNSQDCSDIKTKYDASVNCDSTSCRSSIPVTHWYLLPVRHIR